MKVIIFIFCLPFFIIKFILYLAYTILALIFGGIAIVFGENIDDVSDYIKDVWSTFLPK